MTSASTRRGNSRKSFKRSTVDDPAGGSTDSQANSAQSFVTPERRQALIAHAAYLRAEERGFIPGMELEDWYAAEREIDAQLAASAAKST